MSNLTFSILTPTWNAATFVRDALESVRAQEFPSYEHIVCDNCSTDGTVEIARSFPNVVVSSEPDCGMSDALNRAASLAKGDIIGWCNADDVYCEGTFAKVARIFEDPTVDGVYSNLLLVDRELQPIRIQYHHRPIPWFSVFYIHMPTATFFCRRKIFDDGHRLDTRFKVAMDKDFFSRIMLAGYRFRYVDDVFAKFRIHGGNLSMPGGVVSSRDYDESLLILRERLGLRFPEGKSGRILYGCLFAAARLFRLVLKLPHVRRRGAV